jgi:hypothetical protein
MKIPVACDHVAWEGFVAYRATSGWLIKTGQIAAIRLLMAYSIGQTKSDPERARTFPVN